MPDDATPHQLHILETPAEVAQAVAARFIELAREATVEHGRFSVALAGGSTPRSVYALLASDAYRSQIDWPRVQIFFGDERCVPPEHPDSNYRMAREALLAHVPVPAGNVHRMRGEDEASAAARLYEAELRALFPDATWPRLDLVMLGLGEDGHTASLFPHTTALREERAWVATVRVEQLNAMRLTLTAPAINHAAHVLFTVTGASKAARLRQVLNPAPDAEPLPAQLICPSHGTLEWYVDNAAASS